MPTGLAVRDAHDLARFVEEARQVYQIANTLSNTAFVPAPMKGKPEEIMGAILFGRELDLDPMQSLQSINIIQGRPTLLANAMRGLAMGRGVQFRVDESTETRCVMSAKRPEQQDWTTVQWTVDQARKLGLLNKENWKNQPGTMLIARATSQLCRLVAADVLIGAPYSTEEIQDQAGGVVVPVSAPPAKLKAVPEYAEPELVPDDTTPQLESKPVNLEAKISPSTRAAIMAEFTRANKKDRAERLDIISKVLDKEIKTITDLTEGEGRSVLAILKLDPEWPSVAPVAE